MCYYDFRIKWQDHFLDFLCKDNNVEEFNDWVTVKQLRHEEDAAMFMVQDETLTLLYEAFDTLKKKKRFPT